MEKHKLKRLAGTALLSAVMLLPLTAAQAQGAAAPPPAQTLFVNVRVLDGRSDRLSEPMNVLIEGNRITRMSRASLGTAPGATLIDA